VRWSHIVGVGLLAGIGFTVSLFITGLAFADAPSAAEAKIGILAASAIAGLVGYGTLRIVARTTDGSENGPLLVYDSSSG
jgi:NhaA family Na+:H+ antiporter